MVQTMRGPAARQACLQMCSNIWNFLAVKYSAKYRFSIWGRGAGWEMSLKFSHCCVYVYRGLTSYETIETRDWAFTKKDKALIHAGGGNNLEQFSFHFVIRLTNRTVLLRLIYLLCTNLTGIGPFSPRKCTFVYISCSFLSICVFVSSSKPIQALHGYSNRFAHCKRTMCPVIKLSYIFVR